MRKLLIVLLTLSVAFGALIANAERAVAQTAPQGAFMDEVVFFEQPNAAVALEQVSRGVDMQMYEFNLRSLADKLRALDDPNLWTVQTPGSVNDLWLNPVPHGAGVAGYNPFQHVEVRRAMNYLVDRQFIINEIYGGFGIPYVSPWHGKEPEYRRDASFFQQLDSDFSYNPTRARTEIRNTLLAQPGITEQTPGGPLLYNNALLRVVFVIRTEDIRLDIGNYMANQLESVGITVTRDYSPAAAAFAKVYNGPPDQAVWHLYTEGFALTALVAWRDSWLADFYTRDSGETVWDFYTEPAALRAVAFNLRDGNYSGLAERTAWIRDGARRAVEDGVRVWMVAENAVFVYNRRLTAAVNDLMAGPWGYYTTRSARYGEPGGRMLVGQPVHWNSQWNVYRGFTWLYDATQQRALSDVGVYIHPTTGLAVPFRSTYTVQTTLPTDANLTVPSDAWVYSIGADTWNETDDAFVPVPAGAEAFSKVTYDFQFGNWHDGTPMTMDDVWYNIARFHRTQGGTDRAVNPYTGLQYPVGDIGRIDPRADNPGTVNFWLGLFKGARQVDADTLEIYADYRHIDPGFIALNLDIFPICPWYTKELATQAVLDNEARFDQGQGTIDGKTVIDVIRGNTLALMGADLATLKAANRRPASLANAPAGLGSTITAAEATTAWANLDAWRSFDLDPGSGVRPRNNYYVSNGPFYLDEAKIPVKQTIMKRFAGHVHSADHWDSLIAPTLPVVAVGTIPEIVPGEPASIPLTTTLGGSGTSALAVNYLIRNVGLNQNVLSGRPTQAGTGSWTVAMDQNTTSRFIPGAHEITATAAAGELGIPVGVSKSFIVIPQTVWVERETQRLQADIDGLQDDLADANAALTQANAQIASINSLLTVAVIVAIIGVVVGLVGIAMSMRRGGRAMTRPTEKAGEEL